jgi:hypothetical protein
MWVAPPDATLRRMSQSTPLLQRFLARPPPRYLVSEPDVQRKGGGNPHEKPQCCILPTGAVSSRVCQDDENMSRALWSSDFLVLCVASLAYMYIHIHTYKHSVTGSYATECVTKAGVLREAGRLALAAAENALRTNCVVPEAPGLPRPWSKAMWPTLHGAQAAQAAALILLGWTDAGGGFGVGRRVVRAPLAAKLSQDESALARPPEGRKEQECNPVFACPLVAIPDGRARRRDRNMLCLSVSLSTGVVLQTGRPVRRVA